MSIPAIPESELAKLKGRINNPSLTLIGPFLPLMVHPDIFVTWFLPLFSFAGFYNWRTKILRQYVPNFSLYYWSIFMALLSVQGSFLVWLASYWSLTVLVGLFLGIPWFVYAWRLEASVNSAAEELP